jgi:hypothetical protein
MNAAPAFLLVLAGAALTALLAWALRRSIALEVRRRHHEIGTAVFLQLGVIFAVLLAFAFNEVWGGYNNAASAINDECGSLHGIAIVASTLPEPARGAVLGGVARYVETVTKDEWPAMARGAAADTARDAFVKLWRSVADLELTRAGDLASQGQIMSLLANAHQQRETRLFEMQLDVPPLLWAVLILLTLVLVSFVVFSGIDYMVSQVIFSAIFGGSVVLILVVMRMLDSPFSGALALPSTDFQDTLGRVLALTGAR